MKNSLYNAIANISQSFYDKYVEVNARFRARSGVKTVIIRRELGKCCDWCSQRAGIFNYSNAPEDVFKRHDNCRCIVTVKSEKTGYVDAWSKKVYKTQRDARVARADEIYNQGNKLDELNKLKRIARDEGKRFVETTAYRLKNKYPGNDVSDAKFVIHDGQRHYIKPRKVLLDYKPIERKAAEAVASQLGGTVQMLPRIVNPTNIKCADVAYNGVKFDIKTPEGPKDGSPIGKNIITSNLKRGEGQTRNIILNITDELLAKGTTIEKILTSARRAYYSPQITWLETLIVVYGDEVVSVFEKP